MPRLYAGLFFVALIVSACAPTATPGPVDRDYLGAFVNEGEGILTTVAGREVSIMLSQEQGIDTSDVVITLVNLGTTYLIETADPDGRFLPAVQLEPRLEEDLQKIIVPQIQVDAGWSIRNAGTGNLRLLQSAYLGSTTLEALNVFLARQVLGPGVNLLLQVPENLETFQEIDVYRTPGTLTFLLLGKDPSEGGGTSLLSTIQPGEVKLAAVSMMFHTLKTLETAALIERVRSLREGIIVANAEPSLPLPVTAPELVEAPLECGEDEVLVFVGENGESVGECQPAPWLIEEPLPTATELAEEPQPTPTALPPTPTNTPLPAIYNETFPEVSAQILGNCPANVHDWFTVTGPDGNTYRTWHPVSVRLEPANPESATCSFAHEHGDPPLSEAPLPYFGYAAFHGGQASIIADHVGYKVFSHRTGQNTGWGTPELTGINPDMDMSFWVHQGSASQTRLSERYHDAGFWSRDASGRETEVYYLADTGALADKCGGTNGSGPHRAVASECDFSNELWDFGVKIGNAWSTPVRVAVVNPMNFMRGNPNFLQSVELISTSDEICGVNFFPCEYKIPFGHPNSIWLGNMRMLHDANWQWSNVGSAEIFCTDARGNRAADGLCDAQTPGYILQRVAQVNFYGGISGVWDRTIAALGDALRLSFGAPGGN
ncbi:MAG: hypothetical protein IIC78_07635 [Chloroflexi bacterium]|nr:hypothetical protein [Chloroflexota bacterium]